MAAPSFPGGQPWLDLRAKLLELLDGHLRLAEKGTLGGWRVANGKGAASVKGPECAIYLNVRTVEVEECVARWQADAEWIAASRSFAPMALRALRDVIDGLYDEDGECSCSTAKERARGRRCSCGSSATLRRIATALGVEPEGE